MKPTVAIDFEKGGRKGRLWVGKCKRCERNNCVAFATAQRTTATYAFKKWQGWKWVD